MTKKPVYIVHCIDTEGPLYESVDVTFERLRSIFHLDLEPSVDLLRRLQAGTVNLGGLEAAVQKVVDPHLLAYNDTWDKVDAMLDRLMRESFRTRFAILRVGDGSITGSALTTSITIRIRGAETWDTTMSLNIIDGRFARPVRRRMDCISTIIPIRSAAKPIAAPLTGGRPLTVCNRYCRGGSSIIIGFLPRIVRGFTSSVPTAIGFWNSTSRSTFRIRRWSTTGSMEPSSVC